MKEFKVGKIIMENPQKPQQNRFEFGGSLKGARISKKEHYTAYSREEIEILEWDLKTCKLKGWQLPDWLRWYEEKKKEYGL